MQTSALFSLKNTELNDLRKIICLRKTYILVERISVYKVTENLLEHDRHFKDLIMSAMLLHQ